MEENTMKLCWEDRRRNKDNGAIRSEGLGQFKRSAHLVDGADKKEAVKDRRSKYTHAHCTLLSPTEQSK